jgi:preprotein translocase subunit SecY
MASAIEQLAANLSFSTFNKAEDLKKRIWFTLAVLVVYRLGTYIPLPGINPDVIREFTTQNSGGILGILDMFSGGAISRMTIFALNIMPYISASIIVQLMTSISPHFEALKKEGESGKRKLTQYTRYGTVLLASIQAYGIAVALEKISVSSGSAVLIPGALFKLTTVITLTGATLLVSRLHPVVLVTVYRLSFTLVSLQTCRKHLLKPLNLVVRMQSHGLFSCLSW